MKALADKTWKAAERIVAQRLDAVRVGCTGQATADVENDWLAVEVKTRKRLPAWLLDAMVQACVNAQADRLPIVVLHEKGRQYADALVLLRLGDFRDWFDGQGTKEF